MSILESIGRALRLKSEGRAARYSRLVDDLDNGREVDPQTAAALLQEIGCEDAAALAGDLASRQRARELEAVIQQKDSRKHRAEAAGIAMASLLKRHFDERNELKARQISERGAAQAELDSAHRDAEEVSSAEAELQEVRRTMPHGPVTAAQMRELQAVSVLVGHIVQVQPSWSKFELRGEDGTIQVVPFRHIGVPIRELRAGSAVGYKLAETDDGSWGPQIVSIISQPPMPAPRPAPEPKPPRKGRIFRTKIWESSSFDLTAPQRNTARIARIGATRFTGFLRT